MEDVRNRGPGSDKCDEDVVGVEIGKRRRTE